MLGATARQASAISGIAVRRLARSRRRRGHARRSAAHQRELHRPVGRFGHALVPIVTASTSQAHQVRRALPEHATRARCWDDGGESVMRLPYRALHRGLLADQRRRRDNAGGREVLHERGHDLRVCRSDEPDGRSPGGNVRLRRPARARPTPTARLSRAARSRSTAARSPGKSTSPAATVTIENSDLSVHDEGGASAPIDAQRRHGDRRVRHDSRPRLDDRRLDGVGGLRLQRITGGNRGSCVRLQRRPYLDEPRRIVADADGDELVLLE